MEQSEQSEIMPANQDPRTWFNGNQWAAVERWRAEDAMELHRLRDRIQDLESCLADVRNFLPAPLKEQAEAILFPKP